MNLLTLPVGPNHIPLWATVLLCIFYVAAVALIAYGYVERRRHVREVVRQIKARGKVRMPR